MVILRHGHDGCCSLLLIMTGENVDLFLRSAGNIRLLNMLSNLVSSKSTTESTTY